MRIDNLYTLIVNTFKNNQSIYKDKQWYLIKKDEKLSNKKLIKYIKHRIITNYINMINDISVKRYKKIEAINKNIYNILQDIITLMVYYENKHNHTDNIDLIINNCYLNLINYLEDTEPVIHFEDDNYIVCEKVLKNELNDFTTTRLFLLNILTHLKMKKYNKILIALEEYILKKDK